MVKEIRANDQRGQHATVHREMFVLSDGRGVLVDTPGMRELRLSDAAGLAIVFADIYELTTQCRWRDCRHSGEDECAIQGALDEGTLSAARWWSYRKLALEVGETLHSRGRGVTRRRR